MSEINIAPGKLNVGAVFSQALATLQSKPLFFVFTGLLMGLGSLATPDTDLGSDASVFGGLMIFGVLLTVFLSLVGQVLVARAVSGEIGTDAGADFVPAIQAALPRLLPLLLTGILCSIITVLGLIALVVPGVILALMLSLSGYACILEGRSPVEALKRSRELTRGNRWRLLGLFILAGIAMLGAGLLVFIPAGLISLVPGLGDLVSRVILSAGEGLVTVFGLVLGTHAFLDLRRLKEASEPAPLV
ncbi:MAG: hypothetical protein RL588_1482 [Pseudomonadota bacterium]|jgi:uncharacterized membrane protein